MATGPALDPPPQSPAPAKINRPEGKLLIVCEEERDRRALHTTLYSLGFDIGEVVGGDEALALCRIVHFDAVLVDANISGKDGIRTFLELRRLIPQVAILVLSVNGDQERKIEALEAGADDYLTKPINMRELTARIRATLRRTLPAGAPGKQIIEIGEVSFDTVRCHVHRGARRIRLTPKEFDLLRYLMMHPGVPVTRQRLLNVLWGDEYASRIDCLRMVVSQLRRKIEDDPGAPRYVLTESHIGYLFVDPADWLRKEETHRRSCRSGDGFKK